MASVAMPPVGVSTGPHSVGPVASVPKGKKSVLGLCNTSALTQNCFVIQDSCWVFTSVAALHQHVTHVADHTALYAGMGLSSIFNLGIAPLGFYLGGRSFFKSKKIGDVVGQVFAGITMTRFVNTFVSGVTNFTLKVISLAQVAGTCAVSQAALPILGHIGGAFGAFSYCILSIPFAFKGVNAFRKINQLSKKPDNAYGYLRSEFDLNLNELKALAEMEKSKLPTGVLSDGENGALTHAELNSNKSDGYKIALARKKLCKEAIFKRNYGADALEALKDRINEKPGAKSKEAIVELAKQGAKKQGVMNLLYLTAAVISIVAFALGVASTGGGLLLGALVVSLVAAVIWTALDSHDFVAEWKKGDLSKRDKITIGLLNVVIATMTVVSSVFSAGLAPLLISSVGGSALLVSQIALTIISSKQGKKKVQQSQITK